MVILSTSISKQYDLDVAQMLYMGVMEVFIPATGTTDFVFYTRRFKATQNGTSYQIDVFTVMASFCYSL